VDRGWVDQYQLLFLVVIVVLFKVWPYINPVAKEQRMEPPGNVVFTISWEPGDNDIDMHIACPGEAGVISYQNKDGETCNLLRDDLGAAPDSTSQNYENAYSRGVVPGEYVVNVHCYRCTSAPHRVVVEVNINKGPGKALTPIPVAAVILTRTGDEQTVIRFVIDKEGNILPSSVNNLFRPLVKRKGLIQAERPHQ